MKGFVIVVMCVIAAPGCFWASGDLHSQGMSYEASGLNAPSPMEMSMADLTSAHADMMRAQARTVEAHPELLRGYGGYGWGGYYGGYGAPVVNPNYHYPNYSAPAQGFAQGLGVSETSNQQPVEEQPHVRHEGSQL